MRLVGLGARRLLQTRFIASPCCNCRSKPRFIATAPQASTSDVKGKKRATEWQTDNDTLNTRREHKRWAQPNQTSQPLPTTKDDLLRAISSARIVDTRTALSNLPAEDLHTLNRTVLDRTFAVLAENDERSEALMKQVSVAWGGLKLLRQVMLDRGWELHAWQKRAMFRVGLRWEEVRHDRWKRMRGVPNWDVSGTREKERRALLAEVWQEYAALEDAEAPGADNEEKRYEMFDRYALVLYRQGVQDEDYLRVYQEAAAQAVRYGPPARSSLGSFILSHLFLERQNPSLGLVHLKIMLDGRRLPNKKVMSQLVNLSSEKEDFYEIARNALDSTDTTRALEALHLRRMASLDRAEWIEKHPQLAFIRWLARDSAAVSAELATLRHQALLVALKMWKVAYAADEQGAEAYNTLRFVIREVCTLEAQAPSAASASPLFRAAVDLALRSLPPPWLSTIALPLLRTACLNSSDTELARSIYHVVRARCPPNSEKPFRWSPKDIDIYRALVKAFDYGVDPHFIIRLYTDWTADGLDVPRISGMSSVFRAIGLRGDVNEVRRVIDGLVASGRGDNGALAAHVLRSACLKGDATQLSALFDVLREREMIIPAESYIDVLKCLAKAKGDKRRDMIRVFESIRTRSREAWHLLLEANVNRSPIEQVDVETADKIVETMIAEGSSPDRTALSLLLRGHVRLAQRFPKFRSTLADAVHWILRRARDQRILLDGREVAELATTLAEEKQFERAKEMCEGWWTLTPDQDDADLQGEMTAMSKAGEEIVAFQQSAS